MEPKYYITRIGLSKTNDFFSSFFVSIKGLKHKNHIAFRCKMCGEYSVKKYEILKNIRQKIMYNVCSLFDDFEISNLSQKIQTQNNHCFLGYRKSSHEKCWLSAP